MLSQALANLLDNALKYRASGRSCHIRISGRIEDGRALYDIADNGPGISPDDQPRIFEIFRRLQPDTTPGQGVGLTLVQRCLARMDGRVTLQSTEGTGSIFTIDLPAA
jgi:signal transduction histidine kinase